MEPASAEALRPHVDRLKDWVLAEEGFGNFLNAFFNENKAYFDVYQEEHALHYTTLHKAFAEQFEAEINGWLADEGLREQDLEAMLRLGRDGGDPEIELVIDTMLDIMVYDRWIRNIFEIKRRILGRRIVHAKRR
mmetsp:Transcript_71274/g.139974  ORF Transcript_71274/g.139974 Transcript_71274/m.139974 type:complete len:135 (+) Transcript_71274:139-543(+)